MRRSVERMAGGVGIAPDTSAASDTASATPRGLRVLVVDDEPALVKLLAETLRMLGHEPTVCTSGDAAADRFDPAAHDVVMTDEGMPGLTGLGLIRIIKRRSPKTPVILITGSGGQMDGPRDGVDLILPKPYRLATLRQALANLGTEESVVRDQESRSSTAPHLLTSGPSPLTPDP